MDFRADFVLYKDDDAGRLTPVKEKDAVQCKICRKDSYYFIED